MRTMPLEVQTQPRQSMRGSNAGDGLCIGLAEAARRRLEQTVQQLAEPCGPG